MPDILSFHNSLFFTVLSYYVLFYYCFISLLCYCHFKFMIFYSSVVLSFLGLSNITTTMPATSTTPTIIATAAPVLKVAPRKLQTSAVPAQMYYPPLNLSVSPQVLCSQSHFAALSAVHRSHGLYLPHEQE